MNSSVVFTDGPIEVPAMQVHSREAGAVAEFHGIVREKEGASAISALRYEAYETMARREFDRIFVELSARHPVQDVIVIHRVNRVPVGEASLYVRVIAKHRGQALSFCGELIDRMKKDVPIWKTALPDATSPAGHVAK